MEELLEVGGDTVGYNGTLFAMAAAAAAAASWLAMELGSSLGLSSDLLPEKRLNGLKSPEAACLAAIMFRRFRYCSLFPIKDLEKCC